jgi:6-phosphofructokinase 1
LCSIFGAEAVELIAENDFGKMVAYQGSRVSAIPIRDAVGKLKTVRPDGSLARTARALGICLGD